MSYSGTRLRAEYSIEHLGQRQTLFGENWRVTGSPEPQNSPGQSDKGQTPATGYRGVTGQISIGESAPGFELTNASGKRVKLSSFIGTRVLLSFVDRRERITELGSISDSLWASGVQLVVIARDSPHSLKGLADRDSLRFEMLSDPTGEISASYASYDAGISSIRPGYVLVGRTGVVRMAILGQRLPPGELLEITRYVLTSL